MRALDVLINELCSKKILTFDQPRSKYKCHCGSSLKRTSVRKHLNTKKHKKYEDGLLKILCLICEKECEQQHSCVRCLNYCCQDCNQDNECIFCGHADDIVDNSVSHECNICMENKTDFWECTICTQEHCMRCHTHIRNRKCPFCRSIFEPSIRMLGIMV
jgi:hypothetical protein